MTIQIKLKNSVVQDSTPSTSDLPVVGELALNANINSIGGFMRASNNTIVKIFGPGSVTTPTATTTVSGIAELATSAETTAGSATNRVVTPAGLNAVTVAERTTSNTNYVAKAGSTMTGVLQLTAGSTSAPAINFGASNTGIYQASGANNIRIAVDGSDVISASTAGGVNFVPKATALTSLTLGSQSATNKPLFFADAGSVESASLLLDNSSNEFRVRNNRFSGKIVFAPSSNVEKARIDNGGKLLVGTSTARTNFFNLASTHTPRLQIESTNNDNGRAALGLIYGKANASGPYIVMAKHRSDTVGDNTVVQSGDETGIIAFQGADGSQFVDAARIQGFVDGTPGADDMPGRLEFSTTADGAASPTTRLTIDSAGLVKIPDNGKFVAGAGSDLQISHDSSTGQNIVQASAITRFRTNSLFSFQNSDGSEAILKGTPDAAVELFYNGSKKLETLTDGILVTGKVAATGDLALTSSDGQKIRIGQSNDLEIYHNGTNTIIENSTGNLQVIEAGQFRGRANGYVFNSYNDQEGIIKGFENGAVELYYDGSKKLDTQTSGVTVQGSVVAVGTVPQLRLNTDTNDGSTTRALFGMASSANNFVNGSAVNDVILNCPKDFIISHGTTEIMAQFKDDSSVELYCDGSKKLSTTSSGIQVEGSGILNGAGTNTTTLTLKNATDTTGTKLGHSSNSDRGFIQVTETGADFGIQVGGANTSNMRLELFGDTTTASRICLGTEEMITAAPNGAVSLYFDNSVKLQTTSAGLTISGSQTINGTTIANGHIRVRDHTGTEDGQLMLGTGNDFRMYHDGANSLTFFDAQVGGVRFRTNVGSTARSNIILTTGVALYYDNSKKAETWSSGLRLPSDNNVLALGAGDDLRLWHNATNSIIRNATGQLQIQSNDLRLGTYDLAETYILALQNGRVQLNHDNIESLRTTATGIEIKKTASGQTAQVDVEASGGGQARLNLITSNGSTNRAARIDFFNRNTNQWTIINDYAQNGGDNFDIRHGAEISASFIQDAQVDLYYDNGRKLATTANGITLFGDVRFNNSTWTGETTNGKIQTHGNHMYFQTAGSSWFFRKNNGVTAAVIANNGTYTASDLTFKKDVVTIENPVDTIKKLIGRSFTWKEDDKKSFGVIAQEVETVLPDLVTTSEEPQGSTVEPKKMVNYPAFTGHFIEAIKELASKIETLESEIAKLKAA